MMGSQTDPLRIPEIPKSWNVNSSDWMIDYWGEFSHVSQSRTSINIVIIYFLDVFRLKYTAFICSPVEAMPYLIWL